MWEWAIAVQEPECKKDMKTGTRTLKYLSFRWATGASIIIVRNQAISKYSIIKDQHQATRYLG